MVHIRPRFSTPGTSKYVIHDQHTGDTCYRVPSVCVNWPQQFRLRVIRDWRGLASLQSISHAQAYQRYMVQFPFTVQRHAVQFYVQITPPVPPNNSKQGIIPGGISTKTLLHADGRSSALDLYHPNAAVRSLMIYSYLTGEEIGGLPKLRMVDEYL